MQKIEKYQLVAINIDTKEKYIININGNKYGRTTLENIDFVTSLFSNEQEYIKYLKNRGEIPTDRVVLRINFLQNDKIKILPLIFSDCYITQLTNPTNGLINNNNFTERGDSSRMELILDLLSSLDSKEFYSTLKEQNRLNKANKRSAHYIHNDILISIDCFVEDYVNHVDKSTSCRNITIKNICDKIEYYQHYRTLYLYINSCNEYIKENKNLVK